MDTGQAQEKLERYLQQVIRNGGFDLQYTIACPGAAAETPAPDSGSGSESPSAWAITVDFVGSDVTLLTARNGELLHAIESIAAELLGLQAGEHHRLAFDAEGFRAERTRSLEQAVEQACDNVRRSGRPHAFPPMNSRERRLIHLAAERHGISTASSGEGPRRSVVLYPAGQAPPSEPNFNSAQSPNLPGERRSRPGFGGGSDQSNRGSYRGDSRGNRSGFGGRGGRSGLGGSRPPFGGGQPSGFGGNVADRGSAPRPVSDPQVADPDGQQFRENEPSAEDRARAIRERFRKR